MSKNNFWSLLLKFNNKKNVAQYVQLIKDMD